MSSTEEKSSSRGSTEEQLDLEQKPFRMVEAEKSGISLPFTACQKVVLHYSCQLSVREIVQHCWKLCE